MIFWLVHKGLSYSSSQSLCQQSISQVSLSLTLASAQPHPSSTPTPHQDSSNMALELVFDFDGTVTEEDSIASVVDAALIYHESVSSPEACQSLTNAWDHVVKSYMADLDAYDKGSEPAIQHDHPTPSHVARALFSNDQRRQIQRASLLRIQDAALFRNVPLEHMFRSGQQHREDSVVKLRSGFSDLIDLIRSPSVRMPNSLSTNPARCLVTVC